MMSLTDGNMPLFQKMAGGRGFQEVWYLKFNVPDVPRALWLRFTVLLREDGSKEVAEVWAIFFDQGSTGATKVGLKNTFPLESFVTRGEAGISVGSNVLSERHTSGMLQGIAGVIAWDFDIRDGGKGGYDFIPGSLQRLGLVKNMAITVYEQQFYTGWCEINGLRFEWKDAPGMQGHLGGVKNGYSWLWGHCNTFMDESGDPVPLIWDGLSARARFGKIVLPPLTSMLIRIGDVPVALDGFTDQLRIRSSGGYDGWHFSGSRSGYRFSGTLLARPDLFAGVTYEDTDGSALFCHNSKLCDLSLDITDTKGKKRRYVSRAAAAFEVVTRSANPDVIFLI